MEIFVIGSGAIGSFFACLLDKHGFDVQLVSIHQKKDHVSLYDQDKNLINTLSNIISIQDLSINNESIILLCTKAHQINNLLNTLKINKPSIIISLMNGYGFFDSIKTNYPNSNLIIANTYIGAIINNNDVYIKGYGNTYLSNYDKNKSNILQIKDIFSKLNLPCIIENNYKNISLKKLLVNSIINPITSLFNITNGEIVTDKKIKNHAIKLLTETYNILKLEGLDIPFEEAYNLIFKTADKTSNNISSMLQDIRNMRKTEIDYINGTIINIAKKHKLKHHYNSQLTRLIKQLNRK